VWSIIKMAAMKEVDYDKILMEPYEYICQLKGKEIRVKLIEVTITTRSCAPPLPHDVTLRHITSGI
jgi:hypothetical protein